MAAAKPTCSASARNSRRRASTSLAHRPVYRCAAKRNSRRCANHPRGWRYSVYVLALLAMALGGLGRSGIDPTWSWIPRTACHSGPVGLRRAGGGAGALLPSRAVAGGRAGTRSARLVYRVAIVAPAEPAQPVRHGLAAVGPRSGRPRRRPRADRGGAQRSRRSPDAYVVRPPFGRAASDGALAAGAAQADRGRAGSARRNCEPGYRTCTSNPRDGWWRRRLVHHARRLGIPTR